MKLVAAVMVSPTEHTRYLRPALESLAGFCDLICLRAEEPTAGAVAAAKDLPVAILHAPDTFYVHEGRARQELLDWTQTHRPTHVLAIDADEFVSDGQALRAACESECPVLTLEMGEVWQARRDVLRTREDGGWRTHPVPIVWRAPKNDLTSDWRIRDQALACGREPEAVRAFTRRDCVEPTGVEVLHFGWANEADRQRRYDRYMAHDNGRFHNRGHLTSIMWPDNQVTLLERAWPAALGPYLHDILAVATP